MADVSNQHILDTLTGLIRETEQRLTERMATKEDLAKLEHKLTDDFEQKLADSEQRLSDRMATKEDLQKAQFSLERLERKIKAGQEVNVQHHLATRGMIGDLTRQLGDLRENLGRAAGLTI